MSTELIGQGLVYFGGGMMALAVIAASIAFLVHRRAKKRLEKTLDQAYGPRRRG